MFIHRKFSPCLIMTFTGKKSLFRNNQILVDTTWKEILFLLVLNLILSFKLSKKMFVYFLNLFIYTSNDYILSNEKLFFSDCIFFSKICNRFVWTNLWCKMIFFSKAIMLTKIQPIKEYQWNCCFFEELLYLNSYELFLKEEGTINNGEYLNLCLKLGFYH